MSSITSQRDIVNAYKKETCLVVSLLSRCHPMSSDLSRQIFKENALEKPTQHVFIHLSYYLVSIIDPQKASTFTWPLYDSSSEKNYRTEFSNFLDHYCKLGVISPVLSSYFVNPACFKVTKLIFQLSQIAMKCTLESIMKKESHKKLYKEANEKLQEGNQQFLDFIKTQETQTVDKFLVYQQKKEALLKISEKLKKKIVENEEKIAAIKKKGVLNEIIDDFVSKHNYDENTKCELLKIKNIHEPVPLFDRWRECNDMEMTEIENSWNNKIKPLLELAKDCHDGTKSLIQRHLGEADEESYMVQYNHSSDQINTTDLELQVNSKQKFILKNIVKDETLNFPNLIRGFLIAISYIMKNVEFGDDIYAVNKCLESKRSNYAELVSTMKTLVERVAATDFKLSQKSPFSIIDLNQLQTNLPVIPPIPDLSDLKFCWDSPHCSTDTFTPLNTVKHHINLRNKTIVPTFAKPQIKSMITPFHQPLRPGFLSSLMSTKFGIYDRPKMNMSQNISMISQGTSRGNETIGECSSGFTKQQIQRLLSTKKTSSSKKHKFNSKRPERHNFKKGLFHESGESSGLFRSYSSPNLLENKCSFSKNRVRRLSVMPEDSPPVLEVSGITTLGVNSSPEGVIPIDFNKLMDTPRLPTITISPVEPDEKFNHMLKEAAIDFNKELKLSPLAEPGLKNPETVKAVNKENTPKSNIRLIKKTSSVEKLINRFKKVRASILPKETEESS